MSWEVATVISVFLICVTSILILVPKPEVQTELKKEVEKLKADLAMHQFEYQAISKLAEETKAMLSTHKLAQGLRR